MKTKLRKAFLMIGALGVALVIVPMFAAFEAHVVNVTAKIENALSVNSTHIDFGTVFPQEHLEQPLRVELSRSFLDEDRVDDIEYFIRQKPKCGITAQDGTVLVGPTATGHVGLDDEDKIVIDCGDPPRPTSTGETWGVLPSLCEYISKEDDKSPDNDGELASFHEPYTFVGHQLVWNDTKGRLAKSEQDTVDDWTIDLAVPCFGDHCAQDWEDFVHGINPSADPAQYVQPIENEHKIFGCDLWIEVSGVSCTATSTNGLVVSDTTNTVTENGGAPAEALTFIHPGWTASIPGATWIWENDPVEDPDNDETFTFVKTFTVVGTVSTATLDIAMDNFYTARVNGVVVGSEQVNPTNFTAATQDSYPVANLVPGLNTVEIEATNQGFPGGPTGNPAGLLYKLSYEASECVDGD